MVSPSHLERLQPSKESTNHKARISFGDPHETTRHSLTKNCALNFLNVRNNSGFGRSDEQWPVSISFLGETPTALKYYNETGDQISARGSAWFPYLLSWLMLGLGFRGASMFVIC